MGDLIDSVLQSSVSADPVTQSTTLNPVAQSTVSAYPVTKSRSKVKTDWHEKLQSLTNIVNEELKRQPCPNAEEIKVLGGLEDDSQRRSVYVRVELARLDFEEEPDIAKYLHQVTHFTSKEEEVKFRQSEEGVRIGVLLSKFDQLRESLSLQSSFRAKCRKDPMRVFLRNILAILYFFFILPALFALLPLRLLHPLFRRLGVRNNYLPIDMVQKYFSRGMLLCWGVKVRWESTENLDDQNPTIATISHTSNYDPFIAASGPLAFKFLGKKILFYIPFIGWLIYAWGHVSIDRQHRDLAIASLKIAADKIQRWKRSIAVFPEGTRSKSGRLSEFKKGTFHTALAVGLPITPMIIFGSYSAWPPQRAWGAEGNVRVRVLPRISVTSSDTYQTLLSKTRRLMLAGYEAPLAFHSKALSWTVLDVLFFPLVYVALFFIYSLFK